MKTMLLVIGVVLGLASTMALVGCESGGDSSSDNWDSYVGTWTGTADIPHARTATVTVSGVDGTVHLTDTAGNSATWPWNSDRSFGSTPQFVGTLEFDSSSRGVVHYEGGDVPIQKQ